NDMEELVARERQPLGIDDRPGAPAIRIGQGEIRFEHVTFRYDNHPAPLYDDCSMRSAPGERGGLGGTRVDLFDTIAALAAADSNLAHALRIHY
ncbi:hypothetical protein NO135_21860, partial [Clostridioides difficile]|nr:hypothetical protein [Clostridioides difficile]